MRGTSWLVVAFAMASLNAPARASTAAARPPQSIDAAVLAYQNQQYASALKLFETAAKNGSREAQHTLGYMYREGLGAKPNMAKAMAWYRKAAEQGHAPAQYNLALMYTQGEGAKPDLATARKWFRRAADHGSVEAQVKLAELAAFEGKFEEAFRWFSKAADQDDADAAFNVGSLYYLGRGVAKDEVKATEYYRKAARLGMREARDVLKSVGQDAD